MQQLEVELVVPLFFFKCFFSLIFRDIYFMQKTMVGWPMCEKLKRGKGKGGN